MIKLSNLIEAHEAASADNSITKNLGDGYLCRKNKIYNTIRRAALSAGYKFSRKASGLAADYNVFPLLCLQPILESKVLPYSDNVTVLKNLLANNPEFHFTDAYLIRALKKNYLLHESAHGIAEAVLSARASASVGLGYTRQEMFVLNSFIAESYANAVETIASAFVDSGYHLYFFLLNSYVAWKGEKRTQINALISAFGMKRLLKFQCLAFLFSNLRYDSVPPQQVERLMTTIFENARAAGEHRDALHSIFNAAFSLSPVFREETSRIYFRLYACEQAFDDLHQLDIVENAALMTYICDTFEALAEIVENGDTSVA